MGDLICDLCENPCNGSFRYAHKPYMFRFYHDEEYEKQIEQFQQRKIEVQENLDEGSIIEYTEFGEDTDHSVEYTSNASQLSDWTDAEIYNVDELGETGDIENDRKNRNEYEGLNSELYDKREEKEVDTESKDLRSGSENEYTEPDLYEIEQNKDEDEESSDDQWVSDKAFAAEYEEVENPLSSELIISISNHSKSLINKHLDVTMATGAAILAAFVNINSISNDVTSTYTSIALATLGIAVGIRGVLRASRPGQPTLPECKNCKNIPHPSTGCTPFCHSCGECNESNWRDGSREIHCLVICERCDKNCVLCETKTASVRRHHNDFCANVHGDVSVKISGYCRDGSVLGSSLLIAGVITCAVIPGMGWGMGAALIAACILVCAAVRVSSPLPTIVTKCLTCNKKEDAENYVFSEGCQSWCTCCGVFNDKVKEKGVDEGRTCLQLCEDCSPKHD